MWTTVMTILTPRSSRICDYPNSQVRVESATTQSLTSGLCNPPCLYGNTKSGKRFVYSNSQVMLKFWRSWLLGQVEHWLSELTGQVTTFTTRPPRSGKSFDYPNSQVTYELWLHELLGRLTALTNRTPRSGKNFDYPNS